MAVFKINHADSAYQTYTLLERFFQDIPKQLLDIMETSTSKSHGYSTAVLHNNKAGRPRYIIPEDQLIFLRSKYFTWTAIARLLGVSERTVHRRKQELDISDQLTYSKINDNELACVMNEIEKSLQTLDKVE